MAIDTVKLRSPFLGEDVAHHIESRLVLRRAIDMATGDLLWEFTSGQLEGSYDHRVSLDVKREEWISTPLPGGRVHTYLRDCAPYLIIEGSPHKQLLGHNVSGGSEDVYATCRWFVAEIASQLGCGLPDGADWLVRRLDLAEVYRLPCEAIAEYVAGLNNATYPRRKVVRYGLESIFAPGRTTAAKVYHKGPEFYKHDRRRLKAVLSEEELTKLLAEANDTLRTEISFKARKLDAYLGHSPAVREIDEARLMGDASEEIARLLREGRSAMETVRTAREVHRRLLEHYSRSLAGALYATWVTFSTLGEEVTRKQLTQATFYRHRKQLQEAGVSWHGSDVRIVSSSSLLPADFSPVRKDPRRVTGEAPKVIELLAPYRRHVA